MLPQIQLWLGTDIEIQRINVVVIILDKDVQWLTPGQWWRPNHSDCKHGPVSNLGNNSLHSSEYPKNPTSIPYNMWSKSVELQNTTSWTKQSNQWCYLSSCMRNPILDLKFKLWLLSVLDFILMKFCKSNLLIFNFEAIIKITSDIGCLSWLPI